MVKKPKEIRNFEPVLKRNGFTFARMGGRKSHFIYINRYTGKHITVNKDLNIEVKRRLIKENNLI